MQQLIFSLASNRTMLGVLTQTMEYFIPGTDGLSVYVDIGLLSHVHPDDLPVLGVDGPTNLE